MPLPQLPFKVKATVSWPGEEDGDLGFLEGELIDVYSVVDESWWSGKLRRNGAEGIFPRDYVEVYKSSTSVTPVSIPSTPVKENPAGATIKQQHHQQQQQKQEKRMGNGKSLSPDNLLEQLQLQQRELEIEKLKLLKQQQLHLKLQQSHSQAQKYQLPPAPPPIPYNLDTLNASRVSPPKLHSPKHSALHTVSVTHSSKHDPYGSHSGLASSNVELSQSKQVAPVMHHSNTIEAFSPPQHMCADSSFDLDDDELVQKRRHLERELKQLKLIEKNRKLQMGKSMLHNNNLNGRLGDLSVESSFVSEGVLSSKKNFRSHDDLSKKLSRYSDEEHSPVRYSNERYHGEPVYEHVEDSLYDDVNEDEDQPPPPPKHSVMRHTAGAGRGEIVVDDDFRFTDEQLLRFSQLQQDELKNSIKSLQSDVLNLSELSATSAGSFMRHKYESEYRQKQAGLAGSISAPIQTGSNSNIDHDVSNKEIMESIFQDKKGNRHSNIFKKLLLKKNPGELNQIEQKLQKEQQLLDDADAVHWQTFKADLNRMNSLNTQTKQARTKRIVREERSLIVKPLEFVSEINTNEVLGNDIDEMNWENQNLSNQPVQTRKIESVISRYEIGSDLNDFIGDISIKFQNSKISQIKAILLHLVKFRIIDENVNGGGKILQQKPKLQELLTKGEGSIFQMNYLFKKMLDALQIPSEIVLGFWKRPNEFYHNEQYIINHCWLSVLLDNQFFIIDMFNFVNGGSISNLQVSKENPSTYNEFYFLARPLTVVSTHIPLIIELQHIIPPIDQNIAFYFPRMYSGFYKNQLKFKNFNNALTRLTDLEFFELELEISTDIELFALIKTSKITTNELTLCQVYWNEASQKRIAKIKAILPENESIGVLQIFSGPKGLQKHFDNIHELSIVIPLYHSGSYKPCKFVPRFPTVQSQNNDLYIKQPQTNKIIIKNSYNFEILQHPLMGINSGLGIMNQDFKLVIESPTGKYFKLSKIDQSKPFGVFEANIKCTEVGLYRALVIGDNGTSWYVFAQWECIPGLIKN